MSLLLSVFPHCSNATKSVIEWQKVSVTV